MMKWLKNLPSLATLVGSRWFIGIAAASLVGGAAWMYGSGQLKGYQRGYDRAEAAYIEQIEQAINTTVERRDAQWIEDMENTYEQIKAILEQNKRTIEQERALRKRISELEENRANILSRLRDTDLGTCNLSPDFDSLFAPSAEAPAEPGASPDRGS